MVTRGYCHECTRDFTLQNENDLKCSRCQGSFIEILEGGASNPEEDEEEQSALGRQDQLPGVGGMILSNLISSLLSSANNPSGQERAPQAGQRSFGNGVNVSWGFTSGGSSTQAGSVGQGLRGASGRSDVPTLNSFLSSSFGSNPNEAPDAHVHDDGMGGAGGAGDGRNFNHDNHPGSDNPPNATQIQLDGISRIISQLMGSNPSDQPTGNLENLNRSNGSGIIIGGGPQGLLLNMLMGGNGNLNIGDFAIGDSNLDDIITRLFEQTAGQNSTPRASDEEISKLERIKKDEVSRIKEKKNVDCPICLDVFLDQDSNDEMTGEKATSFPSPWSESSTSGPTVSNSTQQASKLSSDDEVTSAKDGSSDDWVDEEDDPPEQEISNLAGKDEEEKETSDLLASLPCSHLFHDSCLVPWLQENGSCPVCRFKLKSAEEAEARRGEQQSQQHQQVQQNQPNQQEQHQGDENSSSSPAQPSTQRANVIGSSGSFILGPFPARSGSQMPTPFGNLLSLLQPRSSNTQPQPQPQPPTPNSTSTNPFTPTSTSSATPVPTFTSPSQDHYEQHDDSPERRRERMRRAAENRAAGAPSGAGTHEGEESLPQVQGQRGNQTPPGGWGEDFDLD